MPLPEYLFHQGEVQPTRRVRYGRAVVGFPASMGEDEIAEVLQREEQRAEGLARLFQSAEGEPDLSSFSDVVPPVSQGEVENLGTTQGKLDAAARLTGMVPGVGDAVGLAADAHMYATDEKSRNWLNYLMTAMGVLPFVPAASQVKKATDSLRKVDMSISERPNQIVLNKIVVPEDMRGSGVGTEAMNELIAKADAEGKTISLDPSGDFGGNPKRLKEFYKRFGFVENKGKNRDFEISEDMYRPPMPAQSSRLTAYHGSPHDFDKFSMDAIGTGEGAQAYGHGLYFAESEDVANEYRRGVKDMNSIREINEKMSDLAKEMNEYETGYRKYSDPRGYEAAKEYDALMERRSEISNAPGNMYQVEIDASPDELLDWDAPVDPISVLEYGLDIAPVKLSGGKYGLTRIGSDGSGRIIPDIEADSADAAYQQLTGEKVVRLLGRGNDGSQKLLSKGIKGIKYKDGFSRGTDGGTSNYVIFDDRLITISKKYGVAIPVAAAILARESGEDTDHLYQEAT